MLNTYKAFSGSWLVAACVIMAGMSITGCAGRGSASAVSVYDFGPGDLVNMPQNRMAPLSTLALPPVQTTRALDSTALYYRLQYKDAQQPKPYAQARWSMPAGELIDQKLRQQLGQRRSLVNPEDNLQLGKEVRILSLQLEEFSHVFETPEKSVALLKMRATLLEPDTKGARLLAQRHFTVQQPSSTPDASGGVRALRAAVESFSAELEQWLQQQPVQHE